MNAKRALALCLALLLCPLSAFATAAEGESPINRRIDRNTAKTLDFQPEAARARTDSVVIGVSDLIGDVNPFWAATTGDNYAASLLCDELVFADNSGNAGPGVATFTVSADGRTYTFTLRDGVRYADGEPVRSEDYINAIYLLLTPGYDGVYSLESAGIEGVEAYLTGEAEAISGVTRVDDRTFTVTFATSSPAQLLYLGIPALRVATVGDLRRPEGLAGDLAFDAFYESSVASAREADIAALSYGQYFLESMTPGDTATFVKNADYWRGTPYIGTIELLVVPQGEELAAIMEGTVDIISMLGSVEAVDEVADFEKGFINLYTWEGNIVGYLAMDPDNEIFADLNVRKALATGFDRDAARMSRIERYGSLPTMLLFDGFSPSAADMLEEQYPYDYEAASQLLDDAGWTMGEDGYRYRDGKALAFTLVYNVPNPVVDSIMQQLLPGYHMLGIQASTEALSFEEILPRIESGDYDMCFQARELPASAGLAADLFAGLASDEMLARLERMAVAENDPTRQTVLYEMFFQELYLDLSIIPLYRRSEFLLVNARVMNLTITSAHDLTADAYRMFLTDTLEGQW
ncbi:ABC transporter substrate-binding protein [Eubacteriales bacterium OttesenSCG-928-A19]|nr:ABC transporter substrate-binding protein [Eubacteriales bacterium OttesenSCG-928-A19]